MRNIRPTQLARRVLRRLARSTVRRYRYVFIVTYGRSGSTLLMAMLNTIPGYKIHGENYNALFRLYQADVAIAKAHELCAGRAKHRTPASPWYGILRARRSAFRQDLVESFVANILRPGPADRVLGFKEIRFTKAEVPNLNGYLDFLRESFPGCKIVFNHRKPSAAAESSWWALDERAAEKIEAADARFLAISADDRHFHFFYDEIDESLDNVRELFRFLGEELDEPAVRQVLGTRHSPPTAKYAKRPENHESNNQPAAQETPPTASDRSP